MGRRSNAVDIFYNAYALGPTYPFAYMDTNFGATINSAIIATSIAFYERDSGRLEELLQWSTGRNLLITRGFVHACTCTVEARI